MRKALLNISFAAIALFLSTGMAKAQSTKAKELASSHPTRILSGSEIAAAQKSHRTSADFVEFVDPAESQMKSNIPNARKPLRGLSLKPAKAGAEATGSSNIWATVYSNPVDNVLGLYSFTPTNPSTVTLLSNGDFNNTMFRNGVQYKDGIIYGAYYNSSNRTLTITKYNTTTKELTSNQLRVRNSSYAATETAQATDGTVYGQFLTANGQERTLGTVDYSGSGLPKITTIATSQYAYAALGITSDDKLYGIASDGNLYRIDKNTGEETLVGRTGLRIMNRSRQVYYQTGEIDQRTNTFYWLAVDANQASGLYTVNLSNGRATRISDVGGRCAQGMLIPDIAPDSAPAKVQSASVERTDIYQHTGNLKFTAPTKTFDNTKDLSGELIYKLYDETYASTADSLVASGTATAGADVTKEVTLKADGLHRLALTVSNSEGASPRLRFTVVVGSDVPRAVSNLQASLDETDNQKVNITWTASPELGTNGAQIDTAKLVYDIYRVAGDTVTVATGVKGTSYVDNVPPADMKYYTYGVQARVDSLKSSVVWTGNGLVIGHAVDGTNWRTDFSNGDFNLFTVVNSNNDAYTWTRILRGVSINTFGTANDDWIVTPPIKLESKYIYTLYFHTSGLAFSGGNMAMEVKSATDSDFTAQSVSAMTNVIMPVFTPPTDYSYVSTEVKPAEDGDYQIGFHDITPEGVSGSLFMDTIYIVRSAYTDGPDSVTSLKVTPADAGKLAGTVSFNIATTLINGQALDRVDSLNIYRDDKQIAHLQGYNAGQNVTYSDAEIPTSGLHTYKVVAYKNGSDGVVRTGRAGTTTVYIGTDVPKAPQNVVLSDNTSNILAKWNPYTTGYNGENNGYVNADSVSVSLYTFSLYGLGDLVTTSEKGASSAIIDHDPEKAVTDETSTTQELYYLSAVANSDQGSSEQSITTSLVVGPTLGIPYRESFKNGIIDNKFVWTEGNDQFNENTYAAGWNYSSELTQDGDGGGAWWAPYQVQTNLGTLNYLIASGDETSMNLPKISLKGSTNPKLYFYLYNIAGNQASLKVLVAKPDGTETEAASYNLSSLASGWSKQSVDLSSFASERYVIVKFQGIASGSNVTVGIDNINIFNQLSNNLKAAAITTPKSIRAGKQGKVEVAVQNFGSNSAKDYNVVLYADNKPVDTVTVSNSLGTIETANVEFNVKAPVNKKEFSVKAQVEDDNDLDQTDNATESKQITVIPSDYTKVNDLTAANGANGVNLSWNKPTEPEVISVTENFDEYEPFAKEFGDWTLFDGDKGLALPLFRSYSYPGQGTPFAFEAFNPDAITDAFVVTETNKGMKAHSGDQYAAALYAETTDHTADVAADNWLISPLLPGKKQTVTFYASNQVVSSYAYNEKFDVLYSVDKTDTASFVKIESDSINGNVANDVGDNWKQFSVEIPDGAKYFAIHHKSGIGNCYIFGVDDINFDRASLGTNDSVIAYNIYRDGELVGSVKGNVLAYTDNKADDGSHIWNVTVVYQSKSGDVNESSFSNDASLTVVNGIDQINANAQGTYDVYTTDGKAVMLNAKSLNSLKRGIYIINDRKYIVK